MKIYIGCAIQNLDEATYKSLLGDILKLKLKLRDRGHEILNFKSMTNRDSSAEEIFEWDYKQCMDCDAMIALVMYPSIGVGMEMAFCLSRHSLTGRRPAFVFATAQSGTNVSKLLLGCNMPTFKFSWFDCLEDIPDLFELALPPEYQA